METGKEITSKIKKRKPKRKQLDDSSNVISSSSSSSSSNQSSSGSNFFSDSVAVITRYTIRNSRIEKKENIWKEKDGTESVLESSLFPTCTQGVPLGSFASERVGCPHCGQFEESQCECYKLCFD